MTGCHNEVFFMLFFAVRQKNRVAVGDYSHSMVEGGFEEMS